MSSSSPKPPPIRVLLIDDDEDDYVITQDLLGQVRYGEIRMDWIPDPDHGLAAALKGGYDVILVDYRLGRRSGLEIIRDIREAGCRTPSILLTGEGRNNLDIEAFQKGAADYLAKGEINPSLLERSIRYAIERQRSGEVLRESEERFRNLANAVPALIWMAGPDDRLSFVNQGWLDFGGTSLEEEIGKARGEGGHPDDHELLVLTSEAVAARRGFELEVRMRRHDGEFRWMLNTGTPIFLTDGIFNGYVGTCIDITERKIAAEQLAEGRDEALDHARMKSQFLANMTHEIRTPMNGILGMAGLLQKTPLTSEQQELTESVRSSGQSLMRIIDDILDFSRLEAHRLNIDQSPFNLLSVIEDVVELLAESAREKQIELMSSVDPGIPLGLLGDSGRLRQVLLNLVGNAVKFTEEGDVLLDVAVVSEVSDQVTLRIDVRDSGIGMTQETLDQLFTPFMQADGSTTRKYGGTGLGLAISKELVELMKGEISVESEPGRGARFRIVLTFEKDPEGQQFFEQGEPEWKGRKIMVIDDNPNQRRLLCRHFIHLGFDCMELDHGSKAGDVIEEAARQNNPFAAVFAAADVSRHEAKKIVARLTTASVRGKTQIVAMPFGFLSEVLEPLRAAGADDFLPKPIRQSQLYSVLFRLLSRPLSHVRKETEDHSCQLFFKEERFLLLAEFHENAHSLKQQLESAGGNVDWIENGARAMEALKLFRYNAVFVDRDAIGAELSSVLRQTRDLGVDEKEHQVPVIELGMSRGTESNFSLIYPVESASLLDLLHRCRLLPDPIGRGELARTFQALPSAGRDTGEIMDDAQSLESLETTAQEDQALDLERLDQIRGCEDDGENVVRDLLGLFREEVPHRAEELTKALKVHDWQAAGFMTQAIRGVCSNLGANRMEFLCSQLEQAINKRNPQQMAPMVDAIREESVRVEAALEKASEARGEQRRKK